MTNAPHSDPRLAPREPIDSLPPLSDEEVEAAMRELDQDPDEFDDAGQPLA